ncbi:MAG: hypothetical protein QM767_03190 [Anaeromyxobacter sp.]
MITNSAKIRLAAFLTLAAAACATGGGGASGGASSVGGDPRFQQAGARAPAASSLEEAAGAAYKDADTHRKRGDQAREAGASDQARAEYGAAADGYASIQAKYGVSEYQIPINLLASEMYRQAGQFDKAAQLAERVAADPHASQASKATAWHTAATDWVFAANQATKAGKLEPIKMPKLEQRNGAALNPRPPQGEWKSAITAIDGYLALLDFDPEMKKPAEQRPPIAAATLALLAAQVQYASDNMEEARRRFEFINTRFGDDPVILADALPYYAQTFRILGDEAGFQAAVAKVSAELDGQIAKATDEKQKAGLMKAKEAVTREGAGAQFAQAQKLLDAGKTAEAAAAFQALADNGTGDAAGALHNAALAWDKADQSAKAIAARERILKEFPDSKLAPTNALLLASGLAKKGEHLNSAKAYQDFLQKWPDNVNRCLAMQNVAAEYDVARKPADAAEAYLAFGKDPECAKADANSAAKTLYRAASLFSDAKKTARSKEALTACVAVQGVTDTVAKSQIENAKKLLKGK